MNQQRIPSAAAMPATLMLTMTTAILLLSAAGCSSGRAPVVPTPGTEVIGTLVAIKDDRPFDGGVDLTLETVVGARERARVPSVFTSQPREPIMAMHRVVDASKIGDRLRAIGTRDESGALWVESLHLLSSKQ